MLPTVALLVFTDGRNGDLKNALDLFRFIDAAARQGRRCVMVTIARVIGSASRAAGTHMAVREDGQVHGSFSGGCIDAAIAAEALRILDTGRSETIRFGVGSPYLDVRLPCGGGLDLMFHPDPPASVVRKAIETLEARKPLMLWLHHGANVEIGTDSPAEDDIVTAVHMPDLRMFIIGQGAEVEALGRIGASYGAQTVLLSPDEAQVSQARLRGAEAWALKTPAPSPHLLSDPYSAVVMLFHDHDWEAALLEQALSQPAFFVGAMGSRRTHACRVEALRQRGVPDARIASVVGPLGLIPGSRDPDTLALSVMAQVAQRYEEAIAASARARECAAQPVCA